jgi:hypothetical protein
MIVFPDNPLQPIHIDLHYSLRPKAQLANELKGGANNLLEGRMLRIKSQAAAIDQQAVDGINSSLHSAYSLAQDIAKRLHTRVNKGLDSALHKLSTLERHADMQSKSIGQEMPAVLAGPDLFAALGVEDPQHDDEEPPDDSELAWVDVYPEG